MPVADTHGYAGELAGESVRVEVLEWGLTNSGRKPPSTTPLLTSYPPGS
jgi:hypothetical protein